MSSVQSTFPAASYIALHYDSKGVLIDTKHTTNQIDTLKLAHTSAQFASDKTLVQTTIIQSVWYVRTFVGKGCSHSQ